MNTKEIVITVYTLHCIAYNILCFLPFLLYLILFVKFGIVYKSHNTESKRSEIINTIAELIPQRHKVDLKAPGISIIVDIFKVCFLPFLLSFYLSQIIVQY